MSEIKSLPGDENNKQKSVFINKGKINETVYEKQLFNFQKFYDINLGSFSFLSSQFTSHRNIHHIHEIPHIFMTFDFENSTFFLRTFLDWLSSSFVVQFLCSHSNCVQISVFRIYYKIHVMHPSIYKKNYIKAKKNF